MGLTRDQKTLQHLFLQYLMYKYFLTFLTNAEQLKQWRRKKIESVGVWGGGGGARLIIKNLDKQKP